MRRGWVLALVLLASVVFAVPALGGPSITKRVRKLERRVSAITSLVNRQKVEVQSHAEPARDLGNGYFVGDPRCVDGKASGGGVQFFGAGSTTSSYPSPDGKGWHWYGHGEGPVTVYVVCVSGP